MLEPNDSSSPSEPDDDVLAAATCFGCGYALRGLSTTSQCPECGRAFDPNDLATMRGPWTAALLRERRRARRAARALSLAGQALLLAATGTSFLLIAGITGDHYREDIDAILNFGGTIYWLLALIYSNLAIRSNAPANRRWRWRWAVTCLLAVTLVLSIQFDECPHASYLRIGPLQFVRTGENCGGVRHYRYWFHD